MFRLCFGAHFNKTLTLNNFAVPPLSPFTSVRVCQRWPATTFLVRMMPSAHFPSIGVFTKTRVLTIGS